MPSEQYPLNNWRGWPIVPPALVHALKEWMAYPGHSTSWTKDMTAEEALSAMALIAGKGSVVDKLAAVQKSQAESKETTTIPSHVPKRK